MTDDSSANKEQDQGTRSKKSKLPLIVVTALMLGEGAAIFLIAKILFAPDPLDPVAAAETQPEIPVDQAPTTSQTAEVQIAECRPSNNAAGPQRTFRLRVAGLVRDGDVETIKSLVESNRARIEDRMNFVIRSAEPHHLEEPGLQTIKRRMKSELDQILADEKLILEILIPELLEA